MRGAKQTVYEWFIIVEGAGSFPIDMLRYDSSFPFEQTDSFAIGDRRDRRRVVLVRRSVNEGAGQAARWQSFGWRVVLATTDAYEAREARGAALHNTREEG